MKPVPAPKAYAYGAVVYFLLAACSTFWLVAHPGIVGHNWDWGIDWNFEGIRDLRNNAFSAWSNAGLGGPNIAVSNAIYYYILAAFGSPKVLSDAVLLLMFPLGGLAGMFLVRQTLLRLSIGGWYAAWLGGLTFGFSPYFFNEFQGGVLSQLLAHAGLAMVLGILTVYLRTGRNIWLGIAALVSVVIDSSVTDFILSFPLAFLLLCVPFSRRAVFAFGSYALGVIGVNSYWLLSFVHAFLSVTSRGTSYDAIGVNLYNQAPRAWELFTNSGYPFSFFDNAWGPLVFVAGLGAIGLFFGALAFASRGHLRSIVPWIIILFVGIGVAAVGNGPFSPPVLWAYRHVPFMNFLRTPQHLIIVPTIAFSVVIGVGWGAFFTKPRSTYTVAAITLLFLAARAPFFTGDLSSSYLTSPGPGRGLSLFQPSPGYIKAGNSIDRSPLWSRALFVPSTFSPLYIASPFQQAAQGGDPFVLGFTRHGSLLADATGVMSRRGREITRLFNDRLPESLATGMPSLFDASRLILRYDVVVNGGFGDFSLDGGLPYRTRSFLYRHESVWGQPSTEDLVDVYSARAPGRVFLAQKIAVLDGGAADVPDLETINPTVAFATDTSEIQPQGSASSIYSFQDQWDHDIDRATAGLNHLDIREVKNVAVDRSGDFEILLHRRPHEFPNDLALSVDRVQAASPAGLQSRLRRYITHGALWIPAAAVHLRRGHHFIAVRVESTADADGGLIGNNAADIRDYFDRMAVLPLRSMPRMPNYSYRTASIVGIRVPLPGEYRKISLEAKKAETDQVSALVRIPRADRAFPVVTVKGTSLSTASTAPFLSQEGATDQRSIPLPLYWYVAAPLPRIAPSVDVDYFAQPIDFKIASLQAFKGTFSISLSGLNAERKATLTASNVKITTRLNGSLGPFPTVAAATTMSGHPATASLPITVSGGSQQINVSLTPALAVWGLDRGLPVGMNLGAWIELSGIRDPFVSGDIPSGKISVQSGEPITLSHSTPNLPPGDLSALRVTVHPASAVSAVSSQANLYLRCEGETRIYQVPVVGTTDGSRGVLSANLAVLRTISTARSCKMYGFALQLHLLPGFSSVPMQVRDAEIFVRNAWLKATRPLAVERRVQDDVLRFSAQVLARQRIISVSLPAGAPPDMVVEVNGNPLGKRVSLGNWELSSRRLPLHHLLVATPINASAQLVFGNPGRAALLIAGKTIPSRQHAPLDGPYWYLHEGRVYLAWPEKSRLPHRGRLVVIPATWFHNHGSNQRLQLDALSALRKGRNALVITVTGQRYLDVPFAIAAYRAALAPETIFPLDIDGRRYDLRIQDSGASDIALSRPATVRLAKGLHTVTFDPFSNAIRVYFRKEPIEAPPARLTALAVTSPYSSFWRVSLPARTSAEALVFLESFDKSWQLRGVVGAKHFVADGYANGWMLPPGPAASVALYYRGENWVLWGVAASVFSAMVLLFWVFHEPNNLPWVRKRVK